MYTTRELLQQAEEHCILSAANLMELIARSNTAGYREQLFSVVQDLMADAFMIAEFPQEQAEAIELQVSGLTNVNSEE